MVEPGALGVGDRALMRVEVDVPSGWHLWSMAPGPGPLALELRLADGSGLELTDRWYGDAPLEKHDRGFGRVLASYEQGTVHLERPVHAVSTGASTLVGRAQICTLSHCVDSKLRVPVHADISAAPRNVAPPAPALAPLPGPPSGDTGGAATPTATAPTGAAAAPVAPGAGGGLEADLAAAKGRGVLAFMALAFVFGLGALATPCVFPAIPLTISFFSKYSHESAGRSARLAFVYATTMVAAFTILGVLLSVIFGVTGVQQFAAHPVFNLVLAVVLIFFSLNLLGLFEIQAPDFLVNAANRLETDFGDAAQAAAPKRGGYRDYVVVAIAALTSTTVFFTCTVAFVGLVLVAAASGEWFWPTVGMLAFSSAFALPFFLLAMFPRAAKRLQGKAGNWLTATRVMLGFFELAAATKFLSNADLVWSWGVITRELVLALWVPLFFMGGLFLLGKLRLGEGAEHAGDKPTGVLQMLASVVMFGFALHLGVGLIHDRPFGGWIDGWLPPLTARADGGGRGAPEQLSWVHSLSKGRARARAEGKLVFVNYTGYTCTNCRYMEGGVFPHPRIAPLLEQMVLVELYTDGSEPEHEQNRNDQVQRFATAALPLYSVESAEGTVHAFFPSSTNDVEEFRSFLEGAMAKGREGAAAARPPAQGSAPTAPAAFAEERPSAHVKVKATRLEQGEPGVAVVDGKWSLVNLWATWCSPCREELEGFLVEKGSELVQRGGAFRVVAVEGDDKLEEARQYMRKLGVPREAALRVPSDDSDALDPSLGWDESLPFTFLVSPEGKVVWRHTGALKEEQLLAALEAHALR